MFQAKRILGQHTQTVRFTSDGRFCLTGERQCVSLWNPSRSDDYVYLELEEQALLISTYVNGYTHPITSLTSTETSTGKHLLIAGSNKTLLVTDMLTNQVQHKYYGHLGTVNAVATANQGNIFLSGSTDGTVACWDGRSSSNKPIQSLKDAKDSVMDLLIRDNQILTASIDGSLRRYDIRKGILTIDHVGSPIASIKASRDEECVAISCLDSKIRLLELRSGELLNTFEKSHKCLNYKVDVDIIGNDSMVITGSEQETGCAVLYDLVRATPIQTLSTSINGICSSVAAHPTNSSVLLTAQCDGKVTVWERSDTTDIGLKS